MTQRYGLGIRGAAWATAGSQYIAVLVLLRALQRSKVRSASPMLLHDVCRPCQQHVEMLKCE